MEIQQDTIFVSGMGDEVTEEGLVQHFGSIGVIKVTLQGFFVTVSDLVPLSQFVHSTSMCIVLSSY